MQLRSIDFLRDVARPYVGQVPAIHFVGIVGPRGDAYTAELLRSPVYYLARALIAVVVASAIVLPSPLDIGANTRGTSVWQAPPRPG